MSYNKLEKPDRILVVDDIFDNLLVIQTILEDEGYEIEIQEDSKIALAMVEESPPHLILLDVMMPEMDGYEFTRSIRQNQDLPFIPILLITAYDSTSAVEGLDAGADDFIHKPVDADELQARVRSLLRLKHSIDERDHMASLRQDFVSRFTHDLRTPLAASNRVLKLLREGKFFEVPPAVEQIFSTMITSNDDLLNMVNSLLEVYRYEADCKQINLDKVNIYDLINDVVQELTPLAEEKQLTLKLNLANETLLDNEFTIIADRIEIKRVLTNLIGNAIKFTNQGLIEISLQMNSETAEIKIKDTGSGISPEQKAILFERFRPGKNKNSGSGLGLYLSRCIIEAHQGSINVESEPGKGSLFIINLPLTVDI
ncbi:MAG: hybrid sensor histidine kinase/response regulator [Richelia sp. RM2_1_2]|nr:hybrid sensor histidine kinase/response regulator [Richelia sp. SM1_7_0]NJN09524.1 hybrid sensor histidine kinase/response regulator [Richelia sp. RM1_1_1]NJO27243.1 hybrid sensor histidine kinase/response regulator [Richelia sp. SL_2_1]NJO59580.1 hybrid sensor histidine kinase/response regulator [Richelia sp. RM2_1_2]